MPRIPFAELEQTVTAAFVRAGMDDRAAATCARIHTESSCDGVYSHGLNRVARFVDYLARGWVDPAAVPTPVRQLGAIEVWDGHLGPGILNALAMVDCAMAMASQQGAGIVGLRNTTHWMRGGTYGWRAAEQGYVALCWTNTESCMPPWGARTTAVGNNPFVIAVPRAKGALVLDMAMSQYSYGKLQVTRLKGEQLPYPGGFDGAGRLSADPASIEQSMRILPTGFWKGSGLAILLDAAAAILADGLATDGIDRVGKGSCGGASQVFVAIDPRRLGGAAFADAVADGIVAHVHSAEPAAGSGARYPGESTLATRLDQRARGIVVDDGVWSEIRALAGRSADA